MNRGLKTHTLIDIYVWYIEKVLRENPTFYTKSDQSMKMKGIHSIYHKVKGEEVMYMSYLWFRKIIERHNTLARSEITQGRCFSLGAGLGYLRARRVERNFATPTVNVVATVHYRKAHPEKGKVLVYRMTPDYVRIAWHKGVIKNGSIYEFSTCSVFRKQLSKANADDTALKYQYLFFPRKPVK